MTEKQQEELDAMLVRFVKDYQWRMGIVRPCINYYFDTNFSASELLEKYQELRQSEQITSNTTAI